MPALNCSDTYSNANSAVNRLTQPPPMSWRRAVNPHGSMWQGELLQIFPGGVIQQGNKKKKIIPEHGCLKECTSTT